MHPVEEYQDITLTVEGLNWVWNCDTRRKSGVKLLYNPGNRKFKSVGDKLPPTHLSHSKTFSNPFKPFQIKWEVHFSKDLCLLVFIASLWFCMYTGSWQYNMYILILISIYRYDNTNSYIGPVVGATECTKCITAEGQGSPN